MRIVYISLEYLQPIFSGNGALARMQVSELLNQKNILLLFCGNEYGKQIIEKSTPNFQVISINHNSQRDLSLHADYKSFNKGILEKKSSIHAFKPEIIIINDWHAFNAAIELKNELKIPLIYQFFRIFSRDPNFFSNNAEYEQMRKIEESLVQNATLAVQLSEDTKNWCVNNFHVPTEVLYPPLKNEYISEFKKLEQIKPKYFHDPIRFITFVRISPEKQLEEMLQFVAACDFEWELLISGEKVNQKYWDKINSLINDLQIQNRVRFLGVLPIPDLIKQLLDSDAYIHPARYEPFGISIMEAALTGIPVILDISPKIGAGELLSDNKSCIRLDYLHPKEAASRLKAFIQNPQQWESIGKHGQSIAQQLRVEKSIEKLIGYIKKIQYEQLTHSVK